MEDRKPNEIRIYHCSTWDEFILKVRKERMVGDRLFRGHRDLSWALSSRWERFLNRMKNGDRNRNVKKLFAEGAFEGGRDSYLQRFKDLAVGLPGVQTYGLTDNDWWALGRHHGLITPLLDWTRSPYVAAFFAFFDLADHKAPGFKSGMHSRSPLASTSDIVAVWQLVEQDGMTVDNEFEVVTSRVDFAQRQKSQQGLFTLLSHDVHTDVEAYLTSRGLGHLLSRYEISGRDINKALSDLNLMNINPSTLFPDLDGAASMANLWDTYDHLPWL